MGFGEIRLSWYAGEGPRRLRAGGWAPDELARLRAQGPAALLAVLPAELVPAARRLAGLQPTAGRFALVGDEVWFEPRHPFREGTRYSLLWAGVEVASLELPAGDARPVTSVLDIRPTAEAIPRNALRLYVHFSGPMSEGWSGRALRIVDETSGDVLEGALLAMEPELWDPERRRLTVLLDPGRIKRGLRPHQELGYPLHQGRTVVVVVDDAFRDASGRRLTAPASRRYRVGPAVRRRVDPARWGWRWPDGPTDPIRVAFDRPLDHALLHRCIRVLAADGAPVPCLVGVAPGERSVSIRPGGRWEPGAPYRVAIDPRLEDLAGNSLQRVFDRDLDRPGDAPGGRDELTIGFIVGPRPAGTGAPRATGRPRPGA